MPKHLTFEQRAADLGLLLLRLALAAVFVVHGVDKLTDLTATAEGFREMGIPFAGAMGPFVAFVEFAGGLLLAFGLLTPVTGVVLFGDMVVAGLTAHTSGFLADSGGFEYVMVLGLAALALALCGPGRLSLDERFGLSLQRLVLLSREPERRPRGVARTMR